MAEKRVRPAVTVTMSKEWPSVVKKINLPEVALSHVSDAVLMVELQLLDQTMQDAQVFANVTLLVLTVKRATQRHRNARANLE